MARELVIRTARKHPEFDPETLEYVFNVMISGGTLPEPFREHRLDKRSTNWAGMMECHLGADLLLIYRMRRDAAIFHRIGTHSQLFSQKPVSRVAPKDRKRK